MDDYGLNVNVNKNDHVKFLFQLILLLIFRPKSFSLKPTEYKERQDSVTIPFDVSGVLNFFGGKLLRKFTFNLIILHWKNNH